MKRPEVVAKVAAAHRGKPLSPEHIAKIRAKALRGDKHPMRRPDVAAKHGDALRGRPLSPEHIANIAAAKLGKKRPDMVGDKNPSRRPEVRVKLSGDKNPMKRPEVQAKVSAARWTPENRAKHSAAQTGDKNRNWMGGLSREPYAWTFNDELKEEVRRRDGHRCQLCGVPQAECIRKLPIHHINYDKKDSDPLNLVALCRTCHARTNARRKHWTAFFQAMALRRALAELNENSKTQDATA